MMQGGAQVGKTKVGIHSQGGHVGVPVPPGLPKVQHGEGSFQMGQGTRLATTGHAEQQGVEDLEGPTARQP